MATKGEYRVGIAFNPSNMDMVSKIKRAAADFIDLIDTIPEAPTPIDESNVDDDMSYYEWASERVRLKNMAMDFVESAAEKAVKAATKPKP